MIDWSRHGTRLRSSQADEPRRTPPWIASIKRKSGPEQSSWGSARCSGLPGSRRRRNQMGSGGPKVRRSPGKMKMRIIAAFGQSHSSDFLGTSLARRPHERRLSEQQTSFIMSRIQAIWRSRSSVWRLPESPAIKSAKRRTMASMLRSGKRPNPQTTPLVRAFV